MALVCASGVCYSQCQHRTLRQSAIIGKACHTGHMSNAGVNCGVVYFQNVAPEGPVAFALADHVDRRLRWFEMSGGQWVAREFSNINFT